MRLELYGTLGEWAKEESKTKDIINERSIQKLKVIVPYRL